MNIRPITLKDANLYIEKHHRHNGATVGCKFSIAVYDGQELAGVAIAGRPVARKMDDGLTLEITRVCTNGKRNACSMLYGACVRIAKAMGYKKVITYTLEKESGASLKASNFQVSSADCGSCKGWNVPSRPREIVQESLFGEKQKYPLEKKIRWEKIL